MPVLYREMLGGKLGFRSSGLAKAPGLPAEDGQHGRLIKNYPHRPNADGGRGTIMRQNPRLIFNFNQSNAERKSKPATPACLFKQEHDFYLTVLCGPCFQVRPLPRVRKDSLLKPSLLYPSYRYPNTSIQLASLSCLITGLRNDWPIPHRHQPFLSNSTNICLCC